MYSSGRDRFNVFDQDDVKALHKHGAAYEESLSRVGALEKAHKGSKLESLNALALYMQEVSLKAKRDISLNDEARARKVDAELTSALSSAVGKKAAEKITKSFSKEAHTYGYDKAAQNLVKSVGKEGRRFAGAGRKTEKIALFGADKTAGGAVKYAASRTQGVTKRRKRYISTQDRAIAKKQAQTAAKAIMLHQTDNPALKRLEASTKKQVQVQYLIDRRLREMRRTARHLRSIARRVEQNRQTGNSFSLTPEGKQMADSLRVDMQTLQRYARTGQELALKERSQNVTRIDMQAQSLLQTAQTQRRDSKTHVNSPQSRMLRQRLDEKQRVRG